jgi:hypothetical protein
MLGEGFTYFVVRWWRDPGKEFTGRRQRAGRSQECPTAPLGFTLFVGFSGGAVFLGKLWSHYPGPMVELLANDLRAETVGGHL